MGIELIKAEEKDASEIWTMQITSFAELLRKYRDYDASPGNEPLEKVVARLRQPFTYFYFIVSNGVKIGAIRVIDKHSESELKHISPLFILPEYRNRGYAQEAIIKVEQIHGADGWELDTILQEATNCRLYEKMGYQRTGKSIIINPRTTLIFYKK